MLKVIHILLILAFATCCTSSKTSHLEVFNEFLVYHYLVEKDYKNEMHLEFEGNLIFCKLKDEDSFVLVKTQQTLKSEDVFIIDKINNFGNLVKPINDLLNIAQANKFKIDRIYINENNNYSISRRNLKDIIQSDTIVHL